MTYLKYLGDEKPQRLLVLHYVCNKIKPSKFDKNCIELIIKFFFDPIFTNFIKIPITNIKRTYLNCKQLAFGTSRIFIENHSIKIYTLTDSRINIGYISDLTNTQLFTFFNKKNRIITIKINFSWKRCSIKHTDMNFTWAYHINAKKSFSLFFDVFTTDNEVSNSLRLIKYQIH